MAVSRNIRDRRSKLRQLPWGLLAVVATMLCIGLAFIHSAESDFSTADAADSGYLKRQLIFAGVGTALMLVIATGDYRKFGSLAWAAFAAAILLLLACMAIGRTINGAKSWIMIGSFGVQVAEYCKILYVVALAGLLRYRKNLESLGAMALPLGVTGVLLGFILLQPDFGTAMIFVPVFFVMMWASGAPARILVPMQVAGAAMLPIAYFSGLFKTHQMARINTYLASLTGGELDRSGNGYHITMSMNAIGSGGVSGKGYGEGVLSQYDFLPERHTDFIFSVIAEEWGFFGAMLLFALYFVFLVLMLRVALATKEPFGRLLAVGLATMFFAQFVINVGMTCGVMPVTGIPLPFVSYGGSSLMTCLIALGIVLSVHLHPTRVLGR